ncbi:hypothetical protein CDIK_1797 [Cucumispora dikerogammari]|nr:hypothetical protein CDIK_1797 [Cucumispora dikerogammari]
MQIKQIIIILTLRSLELYCRFFMIKTKHHLIKRKDKPNSISTNIKHNNNMNNKNINNNINILFQNIDYINYFTVKQFPRANLESIINASFLNDFLITIMVNKVSKKTFL